MEVEPEVSYTVSVNRKKKFTSKADLETFTREVCCHFYIP